MIKFLAFAEETFSVILLTAIILAGCASGLSPMSMVYGDPAVQVTIKTEPHGAKIYIDGKEIGISPVSFRDSSGELKTFTVEVKKEGYEPLNRVLSRRWDTARLTYRLDPVYYYNLTPLPGLTDKLNTSPKTVAKNLPQIPSQRPSDVDDIPKLRKRLKERDAVALVIGISRYRDEMIPQVRYARRDAEIMASYLESVGGISRSKMKVLTDEGATLSDVAAHVEEWLPRRVSTDTTVFVYYAGHGMPNLTTGKAFLVPYDGHPDFANKLYPMERLYEMLEKLPSKDVVVMLDSCFSGATGRSVLPSGARPMGITVEGTVKLNKIIVLAASSGTQISSDYDDQQHGLFTYFLLKGLRGDADSDENGAVNVGELYEYVQRNVTKVASESLNRDQTPLLLPGRDAIAGREKLPIAISSQ